jgi:hypothetical protein
MSLLYEAIHGIVEGGVMASVEGTPEGDELAKLCVGKLRNMILVEGDPNCKSASYGQLRWSILILLSKICRPSCL